MKKGFYIILLLFYSCYSNSSNTNSVDEKIVERDDLKLKIINDNSKGFLIGENIVLYDSNLNKIESLNFKDIKYINILGKTDKYFKENPNDDYCDEFRYVKISLDNKIGFVDGRKAFKILKNEQTYIFKEENLEFLNTNNFGIGVSDSNGLTYCSVKSPLVIYDISKNLYHLVKITENDFYKDNYSFLELKNDDMNYDEILKLTKNDIGYLMILKREHQDGYSMIEVEITQNEKKEYIAEIKDIKNFD